MTRAELVISGLVQGVFYRASARQEGLRLGLTGRVRNLPGGEVEATVEGPREKVEQFIAWCRRGPPSAQVDDVQVRWLEAKAEFRDFAVSH
jgi:acylphosphatase